ncbi:MAG: cytochrome c-type biogenesis protein CcmH [Rhodocyclales bacterium]|nr:cytochrome c-type biogenesis protein CcmH [Rhodocyclales bacterium]
MRIARVLWRRAVVVVGMTMASAALAGGGVASPAAADPVLEARVQDLSYKLRCLVCQNESIAESRAPLAEDLRNQVREQLAAGKSEAEIIDFLVSRYGDFVLYQPPFKPITLVLWLGPLVLLLSGAGWLVYRLRSREREPAPELSADQRANARALLDGTSAVAKEPRK